MKPLARTGDEHFYAELSELSRFEEVTSLGAYEPAPSSWVVVITDVRGSTKAIEAGRYKDVNALGVASIVAVRNALADLEIPFVFGGDGATMLVPSSRLDAVKSALRGVRATAVSAFDLGLRAGLVPIAALRESGHDVLVARYRASGDAVFAMLGGSGLSEAERRVKDPELSPSHEVEDGPAAADFSGFQCRWQPVPARRGAVISLLVQARVSDRNEAGDIYRAVVRRIESILGGDGRPIAAENLHVVTQRRGLETEAKLKSASRRGPRFARRRLQTSTAASLGRLLMDKHWNAFGFSGATYRASVAANTDFRKFDDTLRMVLDVTLDERAALEGFLDAEHQAGRVYYGVHAAPAALMTCIITDYQANHVHFVDGADGGYALAAKQLKSQLRAK